MTGLQETPRDNAREYILLQLVSNADQSCSERKKKSKLNGRANN